MWTFECSEETAAAPADVWALWSDPSRWPEFDPGVVWARLDGPFVAGAKVTLKPKGGPKTKVEITSADPAHGFSTDARLPLARLRFEHSFAPAGDRTRITSRIVVTGPLSHLFPRLFGLRANELKMVANLARLAEKHTPATPA